MQPSDASWTKTQLVVFFVMILLTIDEVNPMKMVLHVFPSVGPIHIAIACNVAMFYIFISNIKEVGSSERIVRSLEYCTVY
jgi:hypothetical protein